jgi:hypothetical protein
MKLLRIVRSESSKEIIKYIEISEDGTPKELTMVLQYLFGNSSTVGCAQVLCDSSGKKTQFEGLESGKTYFITFEARDKKSIVSWNSNAEFFPQINFQNIKVLDQSEYLNSKINEVKLLVKDKASEMLIKQQENLFTLTQSLSKIHNTLGSQSLKVIDYSAKTNAILSSVNFLIPLLQQSIKDLKQTSEELKVAYDYKPPSHFITKKKILLDPRILNYMKQFSYKDVPLNELTPGEMKRFMKFQMIMDNQITPLSSQNTPSAKRKLKNKTNSGSFNKEPLFK